MKTEKANLFLDLSRYRPRDARDPQEEFFTECWAHTLQNHPDWCKRFVNGLFLKDGAAPKGPFRIYTQERMDERDEQSRIDLWVSGDDGKSNVMVEIKISAKESWTQLRKYLRLKRGKVCLITLDGPSDKERDYYDRKLDRYPNYLGWFSWRDIYKNFEKYIGTIDDESWEKDSLTQMRKYMAEKGMSRFEGFSKGEVQKTSQTPLALYLKLHDFVEDLRKTVAADREVIALQKRLGLTDIKPARTKYWGAEYPGFEMGFSTGNQRRGYGLWVDVSYWGFNRRAKKGLYYSTGLWYTEGQVAKARKLQNRIRGAGLKLKDNFDDWEGRYLAYEIPLEELLKKFGYDQRKISRHVVEQFLVLARGWNATGRR